MRFAAVALFAGAVLADTTTYITDVVTITSCAPTVTNCPAHSTIVSTTSYASVITSTAHVTSTGTIYSCHPTVTNCPYSSKPTTGPSQYANSSTPTGAPTGPSGPSSSGPAGPGSSGPSGPASSGPSGPASSAPSKPSVVTVTVQACPTSLVPTYVPSSSPGSAIPTGGAVCPGCPPSGTGSVTPIKNGTSPTTSSPPKFTGAASTVSGSLFVAGLAGLAAVVLA